MNCPACGAELKDGVKFCNFCGNKIEVVKEVVKEEVEYKPVVEAQPVFTQAVEPRPVVQQPVANEVPQQVAPTPFQPQPVEPPKPKKKKKFGLAYLLTIIVAALMIGNAFLPVAKQTEDYMDEHDAEDNVAGLDEMTYEDFEDASVFEIAKFYTLQSKKLVETAKDYDEDDALVNTTVVTFSTAFVIPTAIAVIGMALILLLALFNKPGAVLVLDFVVAAAFALETWVLKGYGLLGEEAYEIGFAFFIYIGIAAALLICSIWSMIHKSLYRKNKRKLAQA